MTIIPDTEPGFTISTIALGSLLGGLMAAIVIIAIGAL